MQKKRVVALVGCAILLAALAAGTVYSIETTKEGMALRGQVEALVGEMDKKDALIAALMQELDAYKYPPGGVAYHGALSVAQGQLLDRHGEPVQLRGVSSHGILWYPQYGNYRSLKTLRDAGANVFRIAMYTTEGRGYDEYPEDAKLALRTTLENALGADMYAIVDWHVLKEADPNVYVEEAVAFFDEISALYADEPGVIYEICNEPNGDTSWQDIKDYADRVIPTIRRNAPNAIVLVGTPAYCTELADAADDPLDYENVMYTYHYYADLSQGGYGEAIAYAREKGVGVFVSEWGTGDSGDAERMERLLEKSGGFLDTLDEEGISWVSWALSNKDEGHSLLKPGIRAWSGWEANDLTEYGRFVFARLGKDGGG